MGILKQEMAGGRQDQFGDDRRTEIVADQGEFTVEDLIAEEDMVITISHSGYIKRIPVSTYRSSGAAGAGSTAPTSRKTTGSSTCSSPAPTTTCSSSPTRGRSTGSRCTRSRRRAARRGASRWSTASRSSPTEQVAALVPVREFTDDKCLIFATRLGTVKKTVLSAYGNVRSNGICAINIEKGDELIDVQICDQNSDIVLATKDGMSIRFHQSDVREMGRATTGVKGVELEKGDEVIGMVVVRRDATLLVVSEKGFGKRSELSDYRVQKRGGKGIITLKKTDKTGSIVALKEVIPDDELMMITRHGRHHPPAGGRHPGHRAQHPGREGDEPGRRATRWWTWLAW